MKKLVLTICFVAFCLQMLVVAGCGGRTAYPVQMIQPGDNTKSCDTLKAEISMLRIQLQQKQGATEGAERENDTEIAVGLLLFWPALFFTDLDHADRQELEALRARYNHIVSVHNSKCN